MIRLEAYFPKTTVCWSVLLNLRATHLCITLIIPLELYGPKFV